MGQTMRVIAIASALRRRGHEIRYLAGENLAPAVEKHALTVLPLPALPHIDFPPDAGRLARDPDYQHQLMRAMKDNLTILWDAEIAAIRRENPDWIVSGSLLTPFAATRAATTNTTAADPIPCAMTFLQPHGQKTLRHFAQGMAGPDRRSHWAEILRVVAPDIPETAQPQELIRRLLAGVPLILVEGMPEISGDAPLENMGEWGGFIKDKIHYTGPLLPEAPEDLPAPEALKLSYGGRNDQPLVYVTIGGGSGLIGEEFLNLVLEMFRRLPEVRGVIATGLAIPPANLAARRPPENVAIRGFVPGMELIKASDVTVFHGGSSTLMSCIACGRPAVVIPSIGEQEDNGAVLAQHGAGLVLDKQALNAAILTEAVQKIMADQSFTVQAQKLRELGRKYGGAAEAARIIEKCGERRMVGAGAHSGGR